MFDVWRPDDLVTSGYIWLPVRFDGDAMRIDWQESWDLACSSTERSPSTGLGSSARPGKSPPRAARGGTIRITGARLHDRETHDRQRLARPGAPA